MASLLDYLGDPGLPSADPNDPGAIFRRYLAMASQDPSAPSTPSPPMQYPQAQMPALAKPVPPLNITPSAVAPVNPMAAHPQGFMDRLLTGLKQPGMAQALLAGGARLLQAGGPSSTPQGLGQALGSGLESGTGAFQNYQNLQLQRQAQQQALGANQWHTLTPQEIADKKLTAAAPGYNWVGNGNGEVKQVGQDVIKTGVGPTGMPTLLDTRKIGQGGSTGAPQGPYDPDTVDAAATVVMSDPARIKDYASFGQSGQAARMQIQRAVSQKLAAAGMTPSDLVALRARAHAETSNLATLTKQQAQLQAADQLIHANGDRLLQLFDLVDQTGVPMIEGISRSARAKLGGVDPAELTSVLATFQSEVARQLSGNPNMTGVVSDSLRDEIAKMAPGSMSTAQAKRIINRLYLETSIRQQANQQQLSQGAATSVVGGTPSASAVGASGTVSGASGGLTYDPATGTFH